VSGWYENYLTNATAVGNISTHKFSVYENIKKKNYNFSALTFMQMRSGI
jgi:hypothetical protein